MANRNEVLYLSRADVMALDISMRQTITCVESAFLEKSRGEVEAPPKPGIHPQRDAFIHAMPAFLRHTGVAGIKWVSGFPNNPARGLPYISGLLILNDTKNGFPICVMDCSWITAVRTGAATAVAAKRLARGDSVVAGILGCGTQGRSNLEALAVVLEDLEEARAYDVSRRNLENYAEEMSSKLGLRVVPVDSPAKAVEDCDVVVSSGPILKDPTPSIKASWVKRGCFACPLDFDSYWTAEAMFTMDKFCTDDLEQLRYYRKQGYFAKIPAVYAELSELVSGQKAGRTKAEERIMAMHLGSAVSDVAVGKMVYARARRKNRGKWLEL
jgi:ornithine cyclodeaminase/alanine dehydrogenase